ncbi:UNVERIFIED_CONTAM: SusD/RagB family nutrient-binding outer membrane lipoprotein, partial [Prevotella sp. 15_C9]
MAHESSRLDEGPGNGFANQMLEDPTYSNYRMTNELLEALTSTNDPRTLYIGGAYYTDSKRTDITSIVYEKTGSYQGVPAQDFIYNAWAPALTINIDGKDVSVAHHYQKMQPSKLLTDPASPYMHLT